MKLIAFYISIKGDINILYDALIVKNRILDILHKNMVISNILIIINDKNSTPENMIKDIMKTNEEKDLKDIIDKYYDLKDNLGNLKEYFNKLYIQSKVDKSLLFYEKKGLNFKNEFIGKKRTLDFIEENCDSSDDNENESLTRETNNDGKSKLK